MDITAIALLVGMAAVVGGVTALMTWGLVVEARSNRRWREQGFRG
jgi:hypothetical protein